MSKTFAGRRVLDDVALDLMAGEIHGLVGQNGSGKSTLIKILSGYHSPDSGSELWVRGEQLSLPLHPNDPPKLGFAFVHQELGLVAEASVLENLFIAEFQTRFPGRIDRRAERVRAAAVLARVGLDVSPETAVESLSPVERAMLVIGRAMHQLERFGDGALVLDEPTAYLPRDGVERLVEVTRTAAAAGVAVLFVGHDLSEVLDLTDRVTVLRDGVRVACEPSRELDEDSLGELILGFRLDEFYPSFRSTKELQDAPAPLRVEGLVSDGCHDVSFEARAGEVVGITGLAGSGCEVLPYAIFGAVPASGTVTIAGRSLDISKLHPATAMRHGIGLVPGHRQIFGGAASATAAENATLVALDRVVGREGSIRDRAERRMAREMMEDFEVRPPQPDQVFSAFSGGNQQKLVIAKWLAAEPKALILHEPTQGVDVGSRRQILSRVRESAEEGRAMVVVSSDYEDLAGACDRVLVMRRGRIAAELTGDAVNHERILEQCFAVSGDRETNGGSV